MNQVVSLLVFLILISGFYGLYSLSLEVRSIQKQINNYNSKTKEEKENIRILKAEWAHLNRPDYIQTLSQKLPLELLKARQFTKIAQIPLKLDPRILTILPVPRPSLNYNLGVN